MNDPNKTGSSATARERIVAFIVDKRSLFFLLLVIGIFFLLSTNWVQLENNLQEYLPADSESRQGLDVMENQFITYGTATVMVENAGLPEPAGGRRGDQDENAPPGGHCRDHELCLSCHRHLRYPSGLRRCAHRHDDL